MTGQTSPGLPAAVTSVVTQAPVAPQPQVLEEGEGREGEEPPPPEGGEGAAPPEDGARTGAIVGGVCALALVALGALMTALLLLRRSRTRPRAGKVRHAADSRCETRFAAARLHHLAYVRRGASVQPPTSYGTEAPFSEVVRQTHSTLAGSSPLKSPAALSVTQLRPRSPRSRPPQGGLALTGTTNTYFSHTAAPATTTATHLHGATSTLNADVLLRGATGADGVWRRRMVASELARALDALEASGRPFLGEFELLGGERRCVGGQGVVQARLCRVRTQSAHVDATGTCSRGGTHAVRATRARRRRGGDQVLPGGGGLCDRGGALPRGPPARRDARRHAHLRQRRRARRPSCFCALWSSVEWSTREQQKRRQFV